MNSEFIGYSKFTEYMTQNRKKKIYSRVTTGCLCCRKKKVKCDEVKPTCKNCTKSSIICEWSMQKQTIQSLAQFKPKKIKQKSNKFINITDVLSTKLFAKPKESQPQQRDFIFQNDVIEIPHEQNIPDMLKKTSKFTVDFPTSTYFNNNITDLKTIEKTPMVPIQEHSLSNISMENQVLPKLIYPMVSTPGLSQIKLLDNLKDFPIVEEVNPQIFGESHPSSESGEVISLNQEHSKNKDQFVYKSEKTTKKDDDALFRDYLKYLGEKCLPFRNNELSCLNMSYNELKYFDAFLNGFMVAVSPQLTHEKLQPISVILPRGIFNSTLRNVFYACGATYLSWNKKELKSDAEKQFKNCMVSISNLINYNHNDLQNNEDLLLIITTSFCLRERYQCEDSKRNTLFLIASLRIIYYWIHRKVKTNTDSLSLNYFDQEKLKFELNEIFNCLTTNNKITDFSTFNFSLIESIDDDTDIVNTDLSTKDDLVSQINLLSNRKISPFERTMVESFIYNYCVNLLSVDRNMIKYIQSPFQVFQDLKPFLTDPIFNTPVKWMNNPVMGASLPAFELVAKSNWLRLKFPLNKKYCKIGINLQSIAKYYTAPLLPDDVRFKQPEQIQTKLLESCYIGSLTAKACYILLTKLIYPNHGIASIDIKEALDLFYKNLKKIGLNSQAGGLCLWPFVIAGLATSNLEDRNYLLHRIDATTELKKSEAMIRLKQFLILHWENNENLNDIWNVMLEPNAFRDLFV